MVIKNYKNELLVGFILFVCCIITIVYGQHLKANGLEVRTWDWSNLLWILPLFPLLLLQQKATMPAVVAIDQKKHRWVGGFLVGIFFGILDVVLIKMILHPQPYTALPGFLQPFPYSIFLFSAGAIEIELYYRMIPITLGLLLFGWLFKGKFRTAIVVVLAILTSLIEPIQQMPDSAWWFIVYATISGIAMNLWQFKSYIQYGFLASLSVRLGHYSIWHICLGIYVEYFELL